MNAVNKLGIIISFLDFIKVYLGCQKSELHANVVKMQNWVVTIRM